MLAVVSDQPSEPVEPGPLHLRATWVGVCSRVDKESLQLPYSILRLKLSTLSPSDAHNDAVYRTNLVASLPIQQPHLPRLPLPRLHPPHCQLPLHDFQRALRHRRPLPPLALRREGGAVYRALNCPRIARSCARVYRNVCYYRSGCLGESLSIFTTTNAPLAAPHLLQYSPERRPLCTKNLAYENRTNIFTGVFCNAYRHTQRGHRTRTWTPRKSSCPVSPSANLLNWMRCAKATSLGGFLVGTQDSPPRKRITAHAPQSAYRENRHCLDLLRLHHMWSSKRLATF